MNLDDRNLIEQIDAGNMLSHIDALPGQLSTAWKHGHLLELPGPLADVQQVAICGMGGSAISGDLLSALVSGSCHVPFTITRAYDLPTYIIGAETLVIALSHSGSTEETLSAARQAAERGTRLLAITTGGELAKLVQAAGGVVWTYQYHAQPRATIGWLYGLLLAAASRLSLVDDLSAEVEEAVEVLERGRAVLGADSSAAQNPAKRLAGQLVGRIPVIWGAGLLAPVANRWKTQINENAKAAAYFETLPELNHNTVVGLEYPETLARSVVFVTLRSEKYDHPRVAIRQKVTHQLLLQAGIMADEVRAQGESRLAQQMSLVQFGDYVSFYLAMAGGVDPTPILSIDWLKAQLAQAG